MKTGGRLSKLINMKTIVLLRHGESTWNRENRFTGWTDVDLTELGIQEANHAGDLLKDRGMAFDHAYTSYLKRAVKTLNCVLDRLDQDWLPVSKSWRLNEKHYGMLQGLNKSETAQKYGDEQVNKEAEETFGIRHQMLHSYLMEFPRLREPLAYLSGKNFTAPLPHEFTRIMNG